MTSSRPQGWSEERQAGIPVGDGVDQGAVSDRGLLVDTRDAATECDVETAMVRCSNSADFVVSRICVHEHVRVLNVCADHFGDRERGYCRECALLPDGFSHRCGIDVQLAPAP